jgi:hypothetical protein
MRLSAGSGLTVLTSLSALPVGRDSLSAPDFAAAAPPPSILDAVGVEDAPPVSGSRHGRSRSRGSNGVLSQAAAGAAGGMPAAAATPATLWAPSVGLSAQDAAASAPPLRLALAASSEAAEALVALLATAGEREVRHRAGWLLAALGALVPPTPVLWRLPLQIRSDSEMTKQ